MNIVKVGPNTYIDWGKVIAFAVTYLPGYNGEAEKALLTIDVVGRTYQYEVDARNFRRFLKSALEHDFTEAI